MTAVLSATESRHVIRGNSRLSMATLIAMSAAEIHGSHRRRERCEQIAAHLLVSGWFERQHQLICRQARISESEQRRDAIKELQRVGLLPTGLVWWLFSLGLQLFVRYLIEQWNMSERMPASGTDCE